MWNPEHSNETWQTFTTSTNSPGTTYAPATILLHLACPVAGPKTQQCRPWNKIYSTLASSQIGCTFCPHKISLSFRWTPGNRWPVGSWKYSAYHCLSWHSRNYNNVTQRLCLEHPQKSIYHIEDNSRHTDRRKIEIPDIYLQSFLLIAVHRGSSPSLKVRPSCSNSSENT